MNRAFPSFYEGSLEITLTIPLKECARARDSRNPFIIKISIFKLFAPDNSEILRHGWNPIICWDKMGLKRQYHETDHPTQNQGF